MKQITPETEIALFVLKDGNILTHEQDFGCDYYVASLDGEKYVITMEKGSCIYFHHMIG